MEAWSTDVWSVQKEPKNTVVTVAVFSVSHYYYRCFFIWRKHCCVYLNFYVCLICDALNILWHKDLEHSMNPYLAVNPNKECHVFVCVFQLEGRRMVQQRLFESWRQPFLLHLRVQPPDQLCHSHAGGSCGGENNCIRCVKVQTRCSWIDSGARCDGRLLIVSSISPHT